MTIPEKSFRHYRRSDSTLPGLQRKRKPGRRSRRSRTRARCRWSSACRSSQAPRWRRRGCILSTQEFVKGFCCGSDECEQRQRRILKNSWIVYFFCGRGWKIIPKRRKLLGRRVCNRKRVFCEEMKILESMTDRKKQELSASCASSHDAEKYIWIRFRLPRIHIKKVTRSQNRKEVYTLNRLAEVPK